MQLVNEPLTKKHFYWHFLLVFLQRTLLEQYQNQYLICDSNDNASTSLDFSTPTESSRMELIKFVRIKRPGLILEKYRCLNRDNDSRLTLEMFGAVPFFAFVDYKCLKTASEALNLAEDEPLPDINNLTAVSVSASSSVNSNTVICISSVRNRTPISQTVPSRVLKGAFHLIEQII